MAKKKKVKPEEGQLVAVTLSDKKYGLAQVINTKEDDEGFVTHTVWAFFNHHVNSIDELSEVIQSPVEKSKPVFICGMDYEELAKGLWPVIGNAEVKFDNIKIDDEKIKTWQKEEIAGAFLLEMFLGIVPWDSYRDPEYLDKRLLTGYGRPENVLLKSS
ncbi:MAG: hypothetical protein IT249_04955 [Chitinophagaceae bacterium]|nr:hypothetical protein [Chitinophagaceae bacterium]